MKNLPYVMAFAILLAFSCQKNELRDAGAPEDVMNLQVLTVGVADDAQTRVGFDDYNAFYWHKGDKIGVLTSAGFREMTLLDDYQGKATGVFAGDFAETIGDYVIYPSGAHVMESGQLTYVLPSSYTYASIEDDTNSFNPPMIGVVNGESATLTHLGSFFRISVSNIPAGGDDMKFILTADKRITGGFLVDLLADSPVIVTDDSEGNTVTIDFSNAVGGTSGVFYVPVPLGMYGTITVEIKDEDVLLASKTWTDQLVKRKTPKRGSIEVDYVASTDGRYLVVPTE